MKSERGFGEKGKKGEEGKGEREGKGEKKKKVGGGDIKRVNNIGIIWNR